MWLFYVVVLQIKERQRTEQSIITHAYTAIVLVPVAVEVCLPNSLKMNKRQNKAGSNAVLHMSGTQFNQLGSCEVRRLTQLSSTHFIWSG